MNIKDIQAKIISKSGYGIDGRIYFQATSKYPLSIQEVAQIQIELGKHPGGYGIFIDENNISIYSKEKNIYITNWSCSASCD